MKVVIILPTYDERENIEKMIPILQGEVFPRIKNHTMSILVADDNSPDGTADAVKKFMKKWKNIELSLGEKIGLGAALLRAMTYATEKMQADVVFVLDADFFHDPNKIPEFLQKIDEGQDVVIGTRYSNGGSIPRNWGIHRKVFSIAGNLLVRTILMRFYVHDWTGGFRAIRKKVFLKERSKMEQFTGYTFQVAFLHKAIQDGFAVTEVPFHAKDRFLGRSKIAPFQYIVNLLYYVITARMSELVHSPFLKYAITGFIGYLINAISLELFKKYFGLHSGFAASLGAELSIIWNFIVNNFWSFKSEQITSKTKLLYKFLQFNLISLGSLLLIGLVVSIGTHFFGDTTLTRQISLVLGIGFLVIPYSYSMYNIFIWKRWHISFLRKLQNMAG
ncbi:MAG: glycosyltransferase [Candidatus Levybacteria bacterium]|nr:glycosyltransferase [Candidatus Levybacteria bacterium]